MIPGTTNTLVSPPLAAGGPADLSSVSAGLAETTVGDGPESAPPGDDDTTVGDGLSSDRPGDGETTVGDDCDLPLPGDGETTVGDGLSSARPGDVCDPALLQALYRVPMDAPVSRELFPVMAALIAHVLSVDGKQTGENAQ